jgi:tRNA (mo5U34)-methyltransferase
MDGLRCLDIGTFDGFWAFEMERRGAAEVRAIDILDPERWDWPAGSTSAVAEALNRRKAAGRGFDLAREVLGSRVERTQRSIYELDPGEDGRFDFIYVGSLLLHLRDPVGALTRAAGVCRGRILSVDAIDPFLTRMVRRPAADLDAVGRPWWFKPNLQGLVRIAEAAGLRLVEPPRRVRMLPGAGHPRPHPTPRLLRSRDGREILRASRRGDPHAAMLLEPVAPSV